MSIEDELINKLASYDDLHARNIDSLGRNQPSDIPHEEKIKGTRMANLKLKGVLPAPITPFDKKGEVDEQVLRTDKGGDTNG